MCIGRPPYMPEWLPATTIRESWISAGARGLGKFYRPSPVEAAKAKPTDNQSRRPTDAVKLLGQMLCKWSVENHTSGPGTTSGTRNLWFGVLQNAIP